MADDVYKTLARVLFEDGIRCQFQTPGQMVVSRQVGPIWPNRGNSFWVTHTAGRWHLFTWAPIAYRVPESADIEAVCRACMSFGDRAMGDVPAMIVERFNLERLLDVDVERVYQNMKAT